MQTLTPSAQDGTEGLQSVQEIAQDPGPTFSGPAPVAWVGFGAFILIFLVGMVLIIRGRVLRPTQRRAMQSAVFEPAGEDAEITFDDFGAPTDPSAATEEITENDVSEDNLDTDIEPDAEEPSLSAERVAVKPKRSPFAGLFSRKSSRERAADDEQQDIGALNESEEGEAAVTAEGEAATHDDILELSHDQQILGEDENARFQEVQALDEQRALDEARARAEHEAAYERRRNQAAIEQGLQSFAAMDDARTEPSTAPSAIEAEDIYDRLSAALKAQMATLFDRLEAKLENTAPVHAPREAVEEHAVISEAHFAEFAELLSEQIASLREAANVAIEKLTTRIATLETAPAGAAALSSQIADLNRILGGALNTAPGPEAGLSELLIRALPAGSYTSSHKLSNGKIAAALITMPESAAPIVVDDQFPLDAFAAYQRQRLGTGGGATAENNFRGIVRRHIADSVVNFIIRGETGDHAFMLVPSEQLFATLHADFADLIKESRDAGLWMMSPTTLTATLETLHAAIGGAQGKAVGGKLLDEIIALRERVATLESDPPQRETDPSGDGQRRASLWGNGTTPSNDAGSTAAAASQKSKDKELGAAGEFHRSPSPEEEAFERLAREETLSDTDDEHADHGDRPHFPLR